MHLLHVFQQYPEQSDVFGPIYLFCVSFSTIQTSTMTEDEVVCVYGRYGGGMSSAKAALESDTRVC